MQKKKTELEQLSTEINDIHQENEDLMKWTEKAISDYNERINNKLIAFKYKSEQNNTNRTSNFEEEKGNLILQLDEKIDSLKQAVNEQKILNEKKNINEKTSIEKSQNELNELTEKHETEFRNKKEKIDKDIEEYRNGTISRQSQRVNEIEMAKSRRQKDRQKKLDELLEKNKNEINAKVEQIQKEKKEKVDELFKKAEDNSSQVQETTNFKQKKAKLESMHQFIVKQINDKKKEIEKAAAKYQTDLAAIDKLKRQLQRRIEAETRVIDDEYEMKIQVAQVDLQKAIENISKLYDEDENQRGREVIEAIRKVRETKNKNSDFISKKNKELADLRIKNQDEEADLKTNLERIQAGDREFQLKKEIEAFQKKTEEIIQEIETESRTQIQAANDSLTKMLNDHENSKKKLEESLNKDDQDFTEKSKQIESEMKEIERIKEEKIAKIASEYNAKEEEIAKKHGVEVERMRKRIEQAKSRLEEAQDDSKKQYENQLNEWGKGTEERHQKSWLSIMSEVKEANKKTEMLEKKIENLYVQQAKIERVIFDPPQRPEEQQKIAELQTEVSSKTAEIQLKFEYLYNLFEQGPDPNLVQAAKSTRSGLLKSAKSRGLVKTLSNSPNLQSLPPLEGM
ncbi:hypothetical protein TRFO_25055 [Tritrichomonas foetus]|uniref:Uncharacterized protein n=1 Tax=Tritrichomonas foetus TaxID=1144522 RepID=A0A1J4K7L0_9EUKA|nr:hypothetical protein TRFO_25055 [Tritrichomonas foetus]|eukprot:OHT06872.1 hypothetical protein TRFO_25055 [Tritrichomonas foetus]